MASGGTDDNAHLYRNVQELKYRLELTETSLNSLDALDGDKKGQGNMDEGPALTMADLSTEDRTTRQVESLAHAASHRKLASRSSSETSNNVDDPCRGLIENTAISSLKTTSSSLSVSTCYDTEGLRMKLQELRDRNTDLVCQNNRLHNEVEAVCAKLQEANNQLAVTRKKTDEYKYAVPQLEDKLINVHAENESLEKALRDTEERLENSQRQLGEMDSCLRMHKRNTKCLETQLADTLRDKKKLEKDLETAVHSAEELRCSYEELRRKTKEKLKSYKTGHEDLAGKLEEAKQEKAHFLDNIATLHTKTSRLKGELSNHKMDSYCQAEAEKESTRLRADAVRLKKKIAELQASLTDTELMRNENCQLRNIVEDQQQRLDVCHTQLSCSKKQLCQMEQAVAVARAGAQSPHDSGFGYSGQMSTIDRSNLDGSYLDTLTAAGRKSPPQDAARVSELKMRLAQQECEIEQLRKQLACEPCSPVPCMPYLPCQCQCGDSGNSIIDCWRRELMSVLAKNREGERKMVELEEMVRRFESERTTHTAEILSLGKRLEEFVLANSSLENKLTQRNVLINKLEQEVDENENSIAVNERELRKRSLQITSIERLLDQKANEVSQQVALVSELEEAVQRKVVEAQKVRQELQERVNETKVLSEQLETVKQTSKEQQRALESHIEKMSQQLETKSNRVAEYEHKVEQLSQDLSTKEASLIQTKQQLQDHMEQSQNQIHSLETRVDDATKTVKQLESAMVVCKEEIGLYMDQISDMKERHESEINEKVDAMTNMQLDRAQLEQTLNERHEELVHMETTLEQRQKMLVESNRRINDIEEEQARTQRQVEELEHVVMENEKLYKEDLQDAENRVNAISHDLEQTNNAMQIATVTNRELELEKKRLNAQVEDITEELKVEQKEKAEYVTKTVQLESDLSTTKQSLEEKKEQVTDMRREISEKVQQLDERTKQIETVTQQLHKTEEQLEILNVAGTEMQQELTAREEEIEQKARLIGEMKEEMREKMEDLKTKSREIDNLTISLNNRQTELQQRAAQVLQLEMDFVEYKTETEQRIAEMESTIFRSNCENERKDMQISELEACCRKHQDDLEACRAQYIHLEHIGCEQLSSLECQAVRIARLEQLLDEEKRRAIETLKENTCCDTELKNLKEHHQKMMLVLSESRQDLTTCQQENDRLAHELEQAAVVAQAKQAECCHLLECMEVLKSQEAQRDSQMGADIRQLRQQMAAQEDHYKKEVAEFRACMADKDNLAVDLQAKLKLLTEEHDAIKSRLPLLEEQYNGLRKDSHDALIGKEAEIARLEARISGYERATFGHAHTPVSTSTQQSHGLVPHPHPTPPCQIPECPVPVQLTQPVQHCSPEHPHLVYDAHPTVCSQSDIDIHNVATSNNQQHTLRRSTSELSRLYQSSQSLASAGGGTSITNFSRLVTESELSFSLSTPSPSPTHQHLRIKKSLSDTRLNDELHRRSLPLAPQAMLQPSNRCNHATTPDIQDRCDYSASPASLNTSDPNCLQNMLSEINHQYGIHSTETSAGTISPATSRNRPMSSSPGTHLTTKLTLQLSPRMGNVPSQLSSPISSCLGQMSPRLGILSQFSSPVSPIAASSPVPRSPTLSTVTYDSLLSDGPSLGRLKPKSSTHSAQSKLSSRHMSASPDRLKPALKKKTSIKSGNSGRGEELLKSGIQVGSRTQRQPSGGKLRVQPKRDHSHEGDSFTSPHVTTAVSYYTGHDQHVMADTSVDTYGGHSGSPSCTLAPTVGTVSRDHHLSVTMPVSPVSGRTLDSTGMDSLMGVDSTDQEWSPEQCLSRLAERRAALQQRQQQLHRHLHEIEDTILASDPPNTPH